MKKQLEDPEFDYLKEKHWSDELINKARKAGWIRTGVHPEAGKGLLFNWKSADTPPRLNPQIRPRAPRTDEDGKIRKYEFPKDKPPVLWLLQPKPRATKVLIVEGSKQCIIATLYAPPDVEVYGVAGCWSWRKDGLEITDLLRLAGKEVVIGFDADAARNDDVYTAGVTLGETLKADGATGISFLRLQAGKDNGLDDVLLNIEDENQRRAYLARLIDDAKPKPADRRPPKKAKKSGKGGEFFNGTELLAEKLTRAVLAASPAALTAEGRIAVYGQGCYAINGARFTLTVTQLLSDYFRSAHRKTVEEFAVGLLYQNDQILPEVAAEPLLNLRNGMLNLLTEELLPHDPKYLSGIQLPVTWDPDARCPAYERWLAEIIPAQADDLEEVASTMLDPSRTPTKALFAYGPSRSGKSTFLRLLVALAGPYHSAVTLHQLSTNRFTAAHVYGTILNSAADLSSQHVEDLSIFKMMTGQDRIHADRKWGNQFDFTNQALFAFSANEVPTVSESSRAYSERIKPFRFGDSFAGHEDSRREDAMMAELPGILVRLARAWRRWVARGEYLPTPADVRAEFECASDRVQQWLSEECTVTRRVDGSAYTTNDTAPDADMTAKRLLARAFNSRASEQNRASMRESKIIERLLNVPGVVEVRTTQGNRGLNIATKPTNDPPARQLRHLPPTSHDPKLSLVKEEEEKIIGRSREEMPELPEQDGTPPTEDVMIFDLETGSATELHSAGPEWLRLGGYAYGGQDTVLTTDFADLSRQVQRAGHITGHNILGYDLLALARHHELDIMELTRRDAVFDTLLAARHVDPPMAREKGRDFDRRYDLDSLGVKYGLGGKSGDLKGLAKEFGGFDQIPTEDERYRTYLTGDVELSQRLYLHLHNLVGNSSYLRDEHRVAAIAAQITLNGFRVDTDLLSARLQEGEKRKQIALGALHDRFGIPLVDPKGAAYAAPLATKAGKAALIKALEDRGVRNYWVTGKTADIATSREAMRHIGLQHMDDPEIVMLCKLVIAVVTTRSVYSTVADALVGDRVYPSVTMKQSTGRWSLSRPGMTVMGKRGQRYHEREVFLAEPGHVVLTVDLSQVDMRALAGLSGDPDYIAMLAHEDPHAEIARALFGDANKRDEAKTIGHGWNYGRGIRAISDEYELDPGLVRQFDRSMRERFPRLVAWQDEVREIAGSGELLDNGFGRPMRPEPSRAHTQGPALMGQGCARDIMMKGLRRLPDELLPMLRCQVHDEIVLSVPAAEAKDIQQTVIEALSFEWEGPGGTVPIVATGGPTDRTNWGDCYRK